MIKSPLQTPHFQPAANYDLREITRVGSNPIHEAHIEKAFAPNKFKAQQLQNPQAAAQMPGNPWLHLMKGGK